MPFGLCCVAAAIEKNGDHVHLLDLFFSQHCERSIAEAIQEFQPDIIGVGIRNIDNAAGHQTHFLLDSVKHDVILPCKKYFNGPIVIGGAAVGISGEEMLCYFDIPYALRGDGERNLIEFLHRYKNNIPLNGIQGLMRQEGGRILENTPPDFVHDFSEFASAGNVFRFIDVERYAKKHHTPLPVQTKRGCPLQCVYCTYNRIEGQAFRLRAPQRVADEIEALVTDTNLHTFEFTDSVFNLPLDHCKAVLKAIMAKQLDVELRTMGINPCAVDEELTDLMKKAGFKDIYLGAEAGCDTMLKSLGKNFTKKDILKAGNLFHQKGIHINWILLVGAPGENEDTIQKTFDTIEQIALRGDLVTIGVGIRVYKGAPIANIAMSENSHCTQDNFLQPIPYPPQALSLDAIRNIIEEYVLRHPNYLMYNALAKKDNSRLSRYIRKLTFGLAHILHIKFAPHQAHWYSYILYRRIRSIVGVHSSA